MLPCLLTPVAFRYAEALNLWLAFYCDFFGAVLVLAVAAFAVFQKDTLGAANVGLAFSNVIQMLVFYTWVIRFLADTISFWGSAERITGLALNTPKETDLAPPESKSESLPRLSATVSNLALLLQDRHSISGAFQDFCSACALCFLWGMALSPPSCAASGVSLLRQGPAGGCDP